MGRWYQTVVIMSTMGYFLCASWLMSVYKPFELEPLEYKEYVSPEALDEIHGLQNYVAALANIEIETGDAVYTQAAFDLAANQPNLIFQGIQDWVSFWGATPSPYSSDRVPDAGGVAQHRQLHRLVLHRQLP